MNRMDEILDRYGEEYMLRQLAEKCAELNKAALKMIGAQKYEAPVLPIDARKNFTEALADVSVMLTGAKALLTPGEEMELIATRRAKERQLYDRMLDGKTQE